MAIDPAIALQIKPYDASGNNSLVQGLAAIGQIKSQALDAQMKTQQIAAETAKVDASAQSAAAIKATNAAIASSIDPGTKQPDYNKAASILEQGGYGAQGQSLRKLADETEKDHMATMEAKQAWGAKQAGAISNTLAQVTDDSSYHAALGILQSQGIDTSKMSTTYDPAQVKNWVDVGRGHEQTLKDKLTGAQTNEAQSKADNDTATAAKTNALLPGEVTKQADEHTISQQTATGTAPITQEEKLKNAIESRKVAAEEMNARSTRMNVQSEVANRAADKKAVSTDDAAIDGYAKQISEGNPDLMGTLAAKEKMLVGAKLISQGKPIPVPLAADIKGQENNSVIALSHISNMRNLLKDPDVQNSIGPIAGRLAKGETALGSALSKNPRVAEKQQQLMTSMEYLFIKEGKGLMGGRPPQQLMKDLQKVSVNMNMNRDLLNGSLNAAEQSANRTIQGAQALRYGSANAIKNIGAGGTGGTKKADFKFVNGELVAQ